MTSAMARLCRASDAVVVIQSRRRHDADGIGSVVEACVARDGPHQSSGTRFEGADALLRLLSSSSLSFSFSESPSSSEPSLYSALWSGGLEDKPPPSSPQIIKEAGTFGVPIDFDQRGHFREHCNQ